MLNELIFEENREAVVRLSDGQLSALEDVGRRMAGRADWWGSQRKAKQLYVEDEATSVIGIRRRVDGRQSVVFRNVVGSLRIGDLKMQINPKIPLAHFIYLMRRSDVAPRVDSAPIGIGSSYELQELIIAWLVDEAERVLRLGLQRDYSDYTEELAEVRGSIHPVPTALANLSGRAAVFCEYSDLDENAAINRLIKAACGEAASDTRVGSLVRQRARRLATAMAQVGPLRRSDSRFQPTRLHSRYSRVLPLAKLVLAGKGASITAGDLAGRGFLIPTPGIIESGLRNVIAGALAPRDVRKRGLRLVDGGISLNPDLVIERGQAVGDIKYRYFGGDWDRASLNQIVTFATGFGAKSGFIVGFGRGSDQRVPVQVRVGDVAVRKFAWDASSDAHPEQSANLLVAEVRGWLR
jgi:5-methylcytosine-specific restriction enzyme subunit McrC